jgi:hypothetical protein
LSAADDDGLSALARVLVSGWEELVEAAVAAAELVLELEEPHAVSASAASAAATTHAPARRNTAMVWG